MSSSDKLVKVSDLNDWIHHQTCFKGMANYVISNAIDSVPKYEDFNTIADAVLDLFWSNYQDAALDVFIQSNGERCELLPVEVKDLVFKTKEEIRNGRRDN